MLKRTLTLLLTFTLFTTATYSITIFATPDYSTQLEDQQEDLENHKNDYEESQQKIQDIQIKIEIFDSEIEKLLIDIKETENKISELESNILQLEKDIEAAEKEIEDEKELYNNRMVAMYITGGTSYIEILLDAENLTDLLSRIETIKSLSTFNEKVTTALREKQSNIEDQKALLFEKSIEYMNNKEELLKNKETLEKNKDEQQILINEAKEEASKYADLIEKDQSNIEETNKLIEQARIAAEKEAAEKAAREAAAAQAAKEAAEREAASKQTTESTTDNSNNSASDDNNISRGSTSISPNAIVAYASNFLGCPYVWGATGPNYFDCSGFTQYVFAHFGISIPRVSYVQTNFGTYIPKSQLQPGDLVFFGNPVHHVGIYIGNDSFIHAPQTGDVIKISSLSSRSDYYNARRVY
ncbi:C40 family peptidase [Clostridium sp. DL1XJH146]